MSQKIKATLHAASLSLRWLMRSMKKETPLGKMRVLGRLPWMSIR